MKHARNWLVWTFALVIILLAQACMATTYYVSTTGSDSNSGLSSDQAWVTIDHGDQSLILQPGDTVTVLSGTYPIGTSVVGTMAKLSKCGGTIVHPILYQAQGTVVLDRGVVDDVVISIEGSANYVVLDGFHLKRGAGQQLSLTGTQGTEIRNCLFTDQTSLGSAINVYNSTNVLVHNNVIDLRAAPSGLNVGIWGSTSHGGDKYYNNTIIGASNWAFVSGTGNAPVEFTNNIISTADGEAVYGGIYTDNTLFWHSHNIVYGTYSYVLGGYAGTFGSDWLLSDPLFVDPANGDYHLRSGSPAIDWGVRVGLPYQGSLPDLGAFESTGTPVTSTGFVAGRVTEAGTGIYLAGATVKLLDSGDVVVAQATTSSSGDYRIAWATGTWTVVASTGGYVTASSSADITADAITEVNFPLDPSPAQTYYVSPTGDDANTGLSEDQAWATIDNGDINSKLNPGDTVRVLPGTYDVSLNTPGGVYLNKCGGRPAKPITYVAQGSVTIDHGTTYPFPAVDIKGPAAKYIVLDGFRITGGTPIVKLESNTQGNEIKNCTLSQTNFVSAASCLYLYQSGNNSIHNNVMEPKQPTASRGILDQASTGGDKFYNNTIIGATNWSFFSIAGNVPVEFRNNIISTGTAAGSIYSDNTLFVHSNNLSNGTFTTVYGGTAGAGSNNLTGNPLFVDSAGGDYHLQSGSPAIDNGMVVGLSYQGSAPDRGAFETTGSPVTSTGSVIGRVSDASSGFGLAGVRVQLLDAVNAVLTQTTTDVNGYYSTTWSAGPYTLRARLKGYVDGISSVTIVGDASAQEDFVLSIAPARTYYISTTGSDSNTGLSELQAWATINKGDKDNILNPGDTVSVATGAYSVSGGTMGVLLSLCSGTSTLPITYVANGDVTINRGTGTGNAVVIKGPASYIVMDGFKITGGAPIMLIYNATLGNEIKNCTLSQMYATAGSFCMRVTGSGGNKIHNNVIDPKQSVSVNGIYDDLVTALGNKYYNNTIVGVTNWALTTTSTAVPVEFRNNIISSGTAYGGITSSNTASVNSNNIIHGTFTYAYGGYAESQGSNNLLVDPLFVNPVTGDYHLQAGSPAIDAGINVGLPYFGSAPDMGAFETEPVAIEMGRLSDVKSADDGTLVKLTSAMVVTVASGVFADGSIYIEESDRSSGILVLGATGLVLGDRVTLTGTVGTNASGEKYLQVITIDGVTGGSPLGPLGMTNKSEPASMVTGLLVKVWGKVTSVQGTSYCYVDDGSNVDDGTGHVGVRVILNGLAAPLSTLPAVDDRIAVTGAAGLVMDGASVPAVRVRSGLDIVWP